MHKEINRFPTITTTHKLAAFLLLLNSFQFLPFVSGGKGFYGVINSSLYAGAIPLHYLFSLSIATFVYTLLISAAEYLSKIGKSPIILLLVPFALTATYVSHFSPVEMD